MTDNRTTNLREKLMERGIEYATNDHMGVCETSWNGFTVMQLTPSAKLIMTVTPEQAIAATVGNGTCEMRLLWCDYEDGECYECSSCEGMTYTHGWEPSYCERCGAKVVKR